MAQLLLGSYEIQEQLADTAGIEYYKALQQPLGRPVDVIIFHCPNEEILAAAYERVIAIGRLSNPNLENIVDVAKEELRLIIVLENSESVPIAEWLTINAPLRRFQFEQLFYQTCQAVAALVRANALRSHISLKNIHIARTSDDSELLKLKITEISGGPEAFCDIVKSLAVIGLQLTAGKEDIPADLETLLANEQINPNWGKLVWQLYKGETVPADWDDFLKLVAGVSRTLTQRRDTWTLNTTTISDHISLPGRRRRWPLIIGYVVLGVIIGIVWWFMTFKNKQEKPAQNINVAMTAVLSGNNQELGLSLRHGIETAFAAYNDQHGNYHLNLASLDDGYNSQKALQNLQNLLADDNHPVVIGTMGTSSVAQCRTLVVSKGALFLGAYSGADYLQKDPPEELVFNYRPRYHTEIKELLNYLIKRRKFDPRRIAVFYQDGPLGVNTLVSAYKVFKEYGVNNPQDELLQVSYPSNTLDVDAAVDELLSHRDSFDVLLTISTYDATATLLHLLDEKDFHPSVAALSVLGSMSFAEMVKEYKIKQLDLVVSQVVPDYNGSSEWAKAYLEAVDNYGNQHDPDVVSFEGYLSARLLLKGLEKLNGQPVTGSNLAKAMEQLSPAEVSFCTDSLKGHNCSRKIWLATINAAGVVTWLENE